MIRDAKAGDAAAIAAIYAPYVADTVISFERIAPDTTEIARRITETQEAYPYLVAERHGSVVAYAYAGPYRARHAYRQTVEVTAYGAPAAQGQGLGTMLYARLFDRLTDAGFHTAVAIITLPNDKSTAFHERMGFRYVGTLKAVGNKFGQWHDTGIWQKMLGPADKELTP